MTQVANIPEVADLVAAGAHFYVGHSGGKDSQAMYAALAARIPADQLHVVHADLGEVEWSGVKEHIRANVDSEVMIAKAIFNGGRAKDLFDMVRQRRATLDRKGQYDASPWPAPNLSRQCTSDLKTGPIWKVIKAHAKKVGATITVNCVGIRGQESKSRQAKIDKDGTLKRVPHQSSQTRDAYDWWPIAHWSIDSVWQAIADAGQEPHWAYADGNERLSCMYCILGSDNDLQHAYRVNPELAHKYIALEREVRSTMFYRDGKRVSLADRLGIEIEVNAA